VLQLYVIDIQALFIEELLYRETHFDVIYPPKKKNTFRKIVTEGFLLSDKKKKGAESRWLSK
jgi:hypothetical protein